MRIAVRGAAVAIALAACLGFGDASASHHQPQARAIPLPAAEEGAENALHSGLEALKLTAPAGDTGRMVILDDLTFRRGVIEVDIVGEVMVGAPADTRGFVGLAFAVRDSETYESFYIRATNGRSDVQLRRNRAVQYISEPDFPWQRLRAERTGQYESYVDVVEGVWTHLRIEVDETRARLFVNGAPQPALFIERLPNAGVESGGVALWVGPGSIGHFRNLTVTDAE